MKKNALYFLLAFFAVIGIVSCEGRDWDTDDDIKDLSTSWSNEYVDLALDQKIFDRDSSYDKKWSVTTSVLRDTLYKKIHSSYASKYPNRDSVDVISTIIQIRDSLIVKVDGYRYSQKYWAHLYTVDEGILNYEGKFKVDFYETGKTTPWGWSEITYSRNKDTSDRYYLYDKKTKIGWF